MKAVKGRWGGWSGEQGPALLRGASVCGRQARAPKEQGGGGGSAPPLALLLPAPPPTSALLPGQWPRRPGRSLPGTGPCHLAACPVPGVTPGARRAFRWGQVCLLTRLLERDPRGSACSLGPWQGCHAVRTPHSPVQRAGAGGLRPAASSPCPACERTPSSPSQASGRDAAQPPRARHGFVRGPETEPSSKDPRSGPAEVVCDS